ncbi:protein TIC 20-IV, chloroplastic [Medicago truncatula]|uniref:protein TIC 20-IV, chloroplastic n=1 Tax=Medicago truncatula TaxID=3880 RepID=UPI000D2F3EEE|nr:protein TIC 20-IV, chloroplastic [Medicago truncatula]
MVTSHSVVFQCLEDTVLVFVQKHTYTIALEKPEWLPYLIALDMSRAGYYLEPLLETSIFYIPTSVNQLPTWFPFLYIYLAIELVVKYRDFPLILRFHVMMGMLLETAFQIVSVASNYMPLIHFKGTLGMYYWAGLALAYIVIIMHSIRCALLGTFSNIPVISESALLHCLFNIGGFQRPF